MIDATGLRHKDGAVAISSEPDSRAPDQQPKKHSLVSVIMPTYNREVYVCRAIDSVLAQTYSDIEIIVMDDGSTDGTGPLLRKRYGDRIRYIHQKNQGEAAARNEAIRHSRGEYLAFLDSDDEWLPAKLETQVAFMASRPDVGLVSCHTLAIDLDSRLMSDAPRYPRAVPNPVPWETLALDSPLHASTIVMRSSCLDGMEWFPEGVRYGEDRDLWLRVAAVHPVGFVSEPLVCVRRHPGSQTHPLMGAEEAERRLADRLLVNERAFSAYGGDANRLAALKRQAQAAEYARASLAISLSGDYFRGGQLMAEAVGLDPGTWADGRQAVDHYSRHAVLLAELKSVPDAVRFVEGTYGCLPEGLGHWRVRCRRRVLARLYVTLAFAQHRQGQRRLVLKYAARGVCYDPSWLRNAGVWSIAGEALAGERLARAGRSVLGALASLRPAGRRK